MQAFSSPDLVLTVTPNDIGSIELGNSMSRSDHVIIRKRLSLRWPLASDKYDGNFSEMDKSGELDIILQTWWEAEKCISCTDRQKEAMKGNLLLVAYLVAHLYRIRRKRLPKCWKSRITRARKRKQGFHEEQVHTRVMKLHGVLSGEKENVTHPTTVPNGIRGADHWSS